MGMYALAQMKERCGYVKEIVNISVRCMQPARNISSSSKLKYLFQNWCIKM